MPQMTAQMVPTPTPFEAPTVGMALGGLPHWGQQLPLQDVHGSMYPRYAEWRDVYSRMSNGFTKRTFENALSNRWRLTTATADEAPSWFPEQEPCQKWS
jgi:hypothetical protein